ncbi:H-NS histone family protein [Rhodovarius crocodyli]|uniref:H-NS histone family protein n=1 Tax=Rhodovarius crocodyli TaxID=1979269 RepID=A0A437MDH8_9PROT|nr:H-NS histone family protein [Rhodovarius crocodyli]RVT95695.1 H-NS histone family protein [Rhodovarius crocodyli]
MPFQIEELDELSAEELTRVIARASELRTQKLHEAKEALIREFQERAALLGFTAEEMPQDLFGEATPGRKKRSDAGKQQAPKYRSPDGTPWSGRGQPPRWLKALEAEGRHRSEFAVGPEG